MENFTTVYRVIGKTYSMDKPVILAGSAFGGVIKTYEEAKRLKDEFIKKNKEEVARGKATIWAGVISAEYEVSKDNLYEYVKIQSRKVTPWTEEIEK